MNIQIVSSVIATSGMAISALISWFIARSSAEKEIKKLKISWTREDALSSSEEFSDMCGAVAYFARAQQTNTEAEAARQVARVRPKESGVLAKHLDTLYDAIKNENFDLIDDSLARVIEEYRKSRSH